MRFPGHLSRCAIDRLISMSANGNTEIGRCLKQLQCWNFSSFSGENYNRPPVSANRPNTMKERCSVRRKISCLLIHHLAAELKQDVIFLTFPVMNQATSRGFYLLCFPPQAVLHAEEEGAGDVGDRQPLWPPDRMELGCPHPEGQTPQEPAVWVNSKTEDHHDIWLSQRRSIRYYHRWTTNRDLVEGKDFNLT